MEQKQSQKTDRFQLMAAPLQGYTLSDFRNAHRKSCGGADVYFAPFLRLEKGLVRKKELADLRRDLEVESRGITVPQLMVKSPEELAVFVETIRQENVLRESFHFPPFQWIDLNFGCPFPKMTEHGYGAGILAEEDCVKKLLCSLKKYPDFHFSVKMRAGMHCRDDWKKLVGFLIDADLELVVFHGRTGDQGYDGEADWTLCLNFAECYGGRVVYNGDIRTLEQVRFLREKIPHLCGIMAGRGLLANPLLFLEIRENGKRYLQERIQHLEQYTTYFLEEVSRRTDQVLPE